MHVRILGAAAGGGLPQWNCAAPNSAESWTNDAPLKSASQSSIAVSIDGETWALINASPDLRAQIIATPVLRPHPAAQAGLRNSPIRSVLITNGDVDHIAGLLTLREKQVFDLFTTAELHDILTQNPIFNVLDPAFVDRRVIELATPFELLPGLTTTLFSVPGKVPLFLEDGAPPPTEVLGEQTVGCLFEAGGSRFFYIPGCAAMPDDLAARLQGAPLVLFDGTVFHDDEMIRAGVGIKTGARMGHMSMAGPKGSLAAFAPLNVGRKIYVHINNTNPVWRPGAAERAEVEAAGWEIAYDGMEISL